MRLSEIAVVSRVMINATPQTIWNNVVSFPQIDQPWGGPFSFYVPAVAAGPNRG